MTQSLRVETARKFGTLPVFLTAISTILGAVMFLRFGYAVGQVGFLGTLLVILMGHAVTIPTAMAIAEIATNQKVEGGGEYFIISRSFGLTIGGAIGLGLFMSQAISAAFYLIAFAEAFTPVIAWVNESYGMALDKRLFSIPTMVILAMIILRKGADVGMKVLYWVVAILALSLGLFFLGTGDPGNGEGFELLTRTVNDHDSFFYVFAICFPAFTGMTAGVGLSGDLRSPRKSIPLGTLSATLAGMVIYVFIAYKLATNAQPQDLADNQLIMADIALWGPIIPIGLACATLSSALGSLLVAPRTLQAIGGDALFPSFGFNRWLSSGSGAGNEPVNATWVTCIIAVGFLVLGDVNMVAEIISMFFMVTYGSICLISFLEHFAANPSYRPTFVSRWYLSLFGAIACTWLMFQMNTPYAILALVIMAVIYAVISYYNPDKGGLSAIFQGVIFQVSRQLQIFLQGGDKQSGEIHWRPSIVALSRHSFDRHSAFDLVRWISHHHGFGTYIHFVEGYLSRDSYERAHQCKARLIRMAEASRGRVFVDTLISPSATTAICQVVQLPGVSGHENNGILFEFHKNDASDYRDIISNVPLARAANFDIYILGSSQRKFGYRREIHIWLTPHDYENANLMILTAYILLGDPEWRRGTVKIFATYPEDQLHHEEERLRRLIQAGRIPISPNNIVLIARQKGGEVKDLINEHSQEADLVIRGFRADVLKRRGEAIFEGYSDIGDILFVNSSDDKEIASVAEIMETEVTKESEQTLEAAPERNGLAKAEAKLLESKSKAETKGTDTDSPPSSDREKNGDQTPAANGNNQDAKRKD